MWDYPERLSKWRLERKFAKKRFERTDPQV
jgi:hypothetical protein